MRAVLVFIHIIIAYILLRGWPEVLPMWIRAALALIVIMLALPLREKKNAAHQRQLLTSLRKPHWMDFLYIGAVIVVIELLLLSVFTLFPREAETLATDLHEWVQTDEPAELPGSSAPDQLSSQGQGNWLWDNHSQRPLANSSSKQPKNKPDIFIDLLNERTTHRLKQTQIYIKSFSLDYFDGTRWSIHQPSKFTLDRRDTPQLTLNKNKLKNFPVYRARITQSYYEDGQNVFCAIHNPLTTELKSLTKVNTDTYLLTHRPPGGITYNYIATSQPINLDDVLKLDKKIIPAKPPEIDDVYLSQVTNYQLQQNIAELAKTIPKDLDVVAKLQRIRKLIRRQCSYSLEIQNPQRLNPLDNFLFHERKGYCEHFATATAMLCREHGIPSRISYGWTGGKHFVDSTLFVFLSKNAHAWTEIYLQGYGWVIFETTPPSHIQNNQTSDEPAPKDLGNKIGYNVTDTNSDLDTPKKEMPAWKIPVMILCIGAVFTTLVLLLRKFSTSSRSNYTSSHLPASPPKYLPMFEKLCTKLGHPYRSGTTMANNISALKSKTDTLDHLQLDALLDYHYDVIYRNVEPDKTKEASLLKFLKRALNTANSQDGSASI